jgi:4-carboxymuconolactone decarboxylase
MTTEWESRAMSAQEEAQQQSLEAALGILREMLTDAQYQGMAERIESAADDFGRTAFRRSIANGYGDTWTREGLTRKERSLLTIGLMIGLRTPTELGHQFKMAIRNGFTPRQIEEMLIHAQPYAGILVTAAASAVARQSLDEIGIKLTDRTPEDE